MLSNILYVDTQCKMPFGVYDGLKCEACWISEYLHCFYRQSPAGGLFQSLSAEEKRVLSIPAKIKGALWYLAVISKAWDINRPI